MILIIILKGAPKERQRSILGGFWDPLRALWGPLLDMLEGLWLFLVIVWVQHGARNVKMRAYLAQVEVDRGSQRLSGFDFETMFITSCLIFGIVVCVFGEKGFVHAVWYLNLVCCCVFFDFSMAFQHDGRIAFQFAVSFLNQC